MSNLIYINNFLLKNNSSLDDIPGYINFRKISKFIQPSNSMIDRTGIIQNPFKTKILNPIPAFDALFNLSYSDCCMLRMQELDELHIATGKKFRLMYSGGVDSTGIFAAFIKYFGLEKSSDILEICCSRESIDENPWLWDRYIRKGNFKLSSSHKHTQIWNDDVIILHGEVNDQLFGGNDLAGYKRNKDLYTRINIDDYIGAKCGGIKTEDSIYFAEMMIAQAKHAPIPINNSYLISWWYGFSLLYHTNLIKAFSQTTFDTIPKRFINTDFNQFYGTDYFQKWTLKFHYDCPNQYAEWEHYKKPCKDFILEALDIPEYASKIKSPSFTRIHTKRATAICMDEDFNLYHDADKLRDFIESNNSFL